MPSRLIVVIGGCSTTTTGTGGSSDLQEQSFHYQPAAEISRRMPYKLIVVIVDGPCYPICLFQARLGDAESTVKVGRTHYLKSHPVLAMK